MNTDASLDFWCCGVGRFEGTAQFLRCGTCHKIYRMPNRLTLRMVDIEQTPVKLAHIKTVPMT